MVWTLLVVKLQVRVHFTTLSLLLNNRYSFFDFLFEICESVDKLLAIAYQSIFLP